jgi:hypothetical protein
VNPANIFKKITPWLLALFLGPFTFQAFADDDDPSRGMIRTINIDGAAVQNTYYLEASMDNNTSPGHYLYLYGEVILALDKDWGLVVEFPNILARQPLGQGPSALGPVGLSLKYVFYQFGTSDSETAGVFAAQAGGAFVIPNSRFPFMNGSLTPEVLGGFRLGKWFLQANYGYNEMPDHPNLNNLSLDTSLSYSLNSDWFLQCEGNFTDNTFLDNGARGSQMTLVPQIAFQTGDWLFEFGEEFELNASTSATTDLLVARAF